MTENNWREELRQHLDSLNWDRARADVRPFLERDRDIGLVSRETLASLLAGH